jgi:oxygen-dependent protoporphyrinogen oxidase
MRLNLHLNDERPVAIVGGGITGIAAAHRLQQLLPNRNVVLIERSKRPGGKVKTERHPDGFILESGPDCFLSRKPYGLEICQELGIATELHGRIPERQKTYVLRHGQLHRLPEGLSGMVPTELEPLRASTLLSDEGRARVGEETKAPVPPADAGDESLQSFVTRRFGQEAYENLIEPLMSGIYAGKGELLSLEATFPQLRQMELEHGSLIRGFRERDAEQESDVPAFVSLPTGMETLVEAMLGACSNLQVKTETSVTEIRPDDNDGYVLTLQSVHDDRTPEQLYASAVIVTTQAPIAAKLVNKVDAELSEGLDAIPYAGSALVSFAFEADEVTHELDGYGYVIPRAEGRLALACTWTSNKWPGRAPDNRRLIRVYLGRFQEEDVTSWSDEKLSEAAMQELKETLGIDATPLMTRIVRFPLAIPQYTLGHKKRVALLRERVLQHRGLEIAGAYFEGVGIPDCIGQGDKAARRLIQELRWQRDL